MAKFIFSPFILAVLLEVLFIEDDCCCCCCCCGCCACTSILKDGIQIESNGIIVRY